MAAGAIDLRVREGSLGVSRGARVDGLFGVEVGFAEVLDELPVGVAVLDPARRVLVLNRAFEATTGFGRDEVRGAPFCHVLRSNLCPHRCPLDDAAATGGQVTREGDIIRRDRSRVPIRVTVGLVRAHGGGCAGFVVAVTSQGIEGAGQGALESRFGFGHMLGRSAAMERIFKLVPVVSQTDSSILLTGETGTGKDVLAEVIHEASERSKGPFIKVNCGALPETLLESELFGHTKGAFTGAVADKPGRLRLAHNGTLYLTEIGDLPLHLQVKLLTFLDDKVVYPLGGTKGFQADVRIIAATHRDLEGMVAEGGFRQDLLYRLNVVRLHLPPLRERAGDAALLMDHFLKTFATRFSKRIGRISEPARQLLLAYDYPGNVRELSNVIEYAVTVCQDVSLEREHLPSYLLEPPHRPLRSGGQSTSDQSAGIHVPSGGDHVVWGSVERRLILDALVRARGRRGRAAELLGWSRSTLWRKMKHHRLEDSEGDVGDEDRP